MYSASLNHFKGYIQYKTDSWLKTKMQAEQLKEEKLFEQYLISPEVNRDVSEADLIREKPENISIGNYKLWSRSSRLAKEAIEFSDYRCEVNNSHRHFISKYNGQNYVEAHHLIPMEFQEEFEYSLDVHANIVTLCLECHKKIHYGYFNDKKEIIQMLFENREQRLLNSGINMDLESLNSYYYD